MGQAADHQTDIFGTGDTTCPIVNVENCADAHIPAVDMVGYNMASGRPISINNCPGHTTGDLNVAGVFTYGVHVGGGEGVLGTVVLDGVYHNGINVSATIGLRAPNVVLSGAYEYAVRYASGTDKSDVVVTPLTEPTAALCEYVNKGLNATRRAPGYDTIEITAGSPDLTGFAKVIMSLASAGTIATLSGGYAGQEVTIYANNNLCTLTHNNASGTETAANMDLVANANLALTQRKPIALVRQAQASAHRWLQVG